MHARASEELANGEVAGDNGEDEVGYWISPTSIGSGSTPGRCGRPPANGQRTRPGPCLAGRLSARLADSLPFVEKGSCVAVVTGFHLKHHAHPVIPTCTVGLALEKQSCSPWMSGLVALLKICATFTL